MGAKVWLGKGEGVGGKVGEEIWVGEGVGINVDVCVAAPCGGDEIMTHPPEINTSMIAITRQNLNIRTLCHELGIFI